MNINFYDSIFIENRFDVDCRKTFYFMRYKIFYNFLNDYDTDNFLNDCKNASYLRNINNEINCFTT